MGGGTGSTGIIQGLIINSPALVRCVILFNDADVYTEAGITCSPRWLVSNIAAKRTHRTSEILVQG